MLRALLCPTHFGERDSTDPFPGMAFVHSYSWVLPFHAHDLDCKPSQTCPGIVSDTSADVSERTFHARRTTPPRTHRHHTDTSKYSIRYRSSLRAPRHHPLAPHG